MTGLAIALTACLLAIAPGSTDSDAPDPLIPYRGQPVLSVDVQAPPGNDPQELRDLIDIQPGFLLEQRDVQEAIKRLYALGRFSQVTASAERESGVVLLHFVALPLRRLDDISLSGLLHVDKAGLRAALELNAGDEVDTRTAGRLQARAIAYLHRVGYVDATVQITRADEADLGLVAFNLRVDEGPPRRVTQLNLRGRTRLPQQILRDMLRLRPGAVLNLDDLNQDVANLRQAYLDHGFMQVQVPKPYIRVVGNEVTVTFTVEAGERIALAYSGNTVFSDLDLKALYPDPSGAVSNTNLRVFRQRLLRHYRRAGYADATVAMHGYIDRAAGTRRYLVQINEGRPLRVTEVTFPGIRAIPQELLIEQLSTLLRRELADDPIFSRLQAVDRAERGGPWRDAPPPPPLRLASDERWVPDLYQEAADQIAAALHDLGYLTAELGTPRLAPVGGRPGDPLCPPARHGMTLARQECPVIVQVPVREGEQTFTHSVGFAGNVSFAADTLLEVVSEATSGHQLSAPVLPGSPLSYNRVEDGRIELLRHYRNQGYLYARAFSKVELITSGPNKAWANVSYSVEEGPQVHVQRLLVRGNRFTREGVIRSRIALQPGDLYRLEQAVADQRSIATLGVFSSARVKLIDEEHPAEQKDAVAEVVERNRHSMEVAPGISTANGPRLRLQYSHLNLLGTASQGTLSLKVNRQIFFDLFGQYADELRGRYNSWKNWDQILKALEREIRAGIRSPPIRALPFDPLVRLDLVNQRVNNVLYSLDSAAAILGIDMIMGHGFKGSLEGQIGLTNLECVGTAVDCNENPELRRQQNRPINVGRLWTLKGGPLLIWDKRDSPVNPTRGLFVTARYTYAIGASGASSTAQWEPLAFSKYEGSITGYVPIWRLILALQARAGTIGVVRSQVPIDERFFMGGRDTLRGYVESTLIPQDDTTDRTTGGQPPLSQGGNTFMVLKTELRVPVVDNLYLSVFLDVGNLWITLTQHNFVMRYGTGFGVRYNTPVGALAIDMGFNPQPRAAVSEATYQLHFSIGAF